MEPGPATGGRSRPYRRQALSRKAPSKKGLQHLHVQSISLHTVRMYRAITANGRPYQVAWSWDTVVAAAQELLLYRRVPAASGQALLQRALNWVAIQDPQSFQQALREVISQYALLAHGSALARRRLLHAVSTIEAWDGQGWRQPPPIPPHTPRSWATGEQQRLPRRLGPRGIAWQRQRGLRGPQADAGPV